MNLSDDQKEDIRDQVNGLLVMCEKSKEQARKENKRFDFNTASNFESGVRALAEILLPEEDALNAPRL